MSRALEDLDVTFQGKVTTLLDACAERGVIMRPFFTLRTPQEQARLWRQSRTGFEIKAAINRLRNSGANYLADCIEKVGPSNGAWATDAMPGYSWHNWGKAVDCFVVSDGGRAIWDSSHEGYEVYAEEAKKLGLTAGYDFRKRDAVHVQMPAHEASRLNVKIINAEMMKRFGGSNG